MTRTACVFPGQGSQTIGMLDNLITIDKKAREIIKNSRVQLFLVDDRFKLAKFIKANIFGKKIVIGMGAGTISSWMRELPKLLS